MKNPLYEVVINFVDFSEAIWCTALHYFKQHSYDGALSTTAPPCIETFKLIRHHTRHLTEVPFVTISRGMFS